MIRLLSRIGWWLLIWPDDPKEVALRIGVVMALVLIGLVIADIVQYGFHWGNLVTATAFIVGTSAAGIVLGLWLSRRIKRNRP